MSWVDSNVQASLTLCLCSLSKTQVGFVLIVLALKIPDRADRASSQKPLPLRVEDGVPSPLQKIRGTQSGNRLNPS